MSSNSSSPLLISLAHDAASHSSLLVQATREHACEPRTSREFSSLSPNDHLLELFARESYATIAGANCRPICNASWAALFPAGDQANWKTRPAPLIAEAPRAAAPPPSPLIMIAIIISGHTKGRATSTECASLLSLAPGRILCSLARSLAIVCACVPVRNLNSGRVINNEKFAVRTPHRATESYRTFSCSLC